MLTSGIYTIALLILNTPGPSSLETFHKNANPQPNPLGQLLPSQTNSESPCLIEPHLNRSRRQAPKYLEPLKLTVNGVPNSTYFLKPLGIIVLLTDQRGTIVAEAPPTDVTAKLATFEPKRGGKKDLQGNTSVKLVKGEAVFADLRIGNIGTNYKIEFSCGVVVGFGSVVGFVSELIKVSERPFQVISTTEAFPQEIGLVVNPAPIVTIIDVVTNKSAGPELLRDYEWEFEVGFRNKVYQTELTGTMKKKFKNKTRYSFEDLKFAKKPGYKIYLQFKVVCVPQKNRNSTFDFGPFDVTFPKQFGEVVSGHVWKSTATFKSDDTMKLKGKEELFGIRFLNVYGVKYHKVRWSNVTLKLGGNNSISTTALVSGNTLAFTEYEKLFKNETGTKFELEVNSSTKITWTVNPFKVFDPKAPIAKPPAKKDGSGTNSPSVLLISLIILLLKLQINVI